MGSIFHCFSLLTRFLTAMVVISETSNDDPPKNSQEDEQKPITRSFTCAIPNEVIETCVAKVLRCQYPTLSCVSRFFRNLLASPEPYKLRLLLNTTEPVLYAFVGFPFSVKQRWYMLHRIPHQNQLRLCIILSLPPMPLGSALVTIGHNMYIIGGWDDNDRVAAQVFLIDCITHTRRQLPNMNKARYGAAAGVFDGKIYIIGGIGPLFSGTDWIEVMDVKTGLWNPVPGPYSYLGRTREFQTYVVMQEKIYAVIRDFCLSYEPKTGKWESHDTLGGLWHKCSCVVDDMLYTVYPKRVAHKSSVIVYDPVKKNCVAVKGVDSLPQLFYDDSKMVNFGGKLMILGASRCTLGDEEIWCVVISLERRKGGEIWGKIESVKPVLTSLLNLPSVDLCATVTV